MKCVSKDLAAFTTAIHVGFPTVENVVQLCCVVTGLILVDQTSHGIFSNGSHLFLFTINVFHSILIPISIQSSFVHHCLNFELVRLNETPLDLDLVSPAAEVELSAGLAPANPRLTLSIAIKLPLDRSDERLSVVQISSILFPSLKPIVQTLISQSIYPFSQRSLALLVEGLRDSSTLILASHQFVSRGTFQLLHVIHLLD